MSDFLTRVVRTVAAYIWAWLALRLAEWLGVSFDAAQTAAVQEALVIVLGAIIYAAIAALSKQFPFLERLLIVNVRPLYRRV